ncbi:MAG: peptide ABC transporter substrate-binding protein [Planctomycetes bacterium]|nr:peptide ABC transporter substrate-binding protein [Planctomycetota bacterium]
MDKTVLTILLVFLCASLGFVAFTERTPRADFVIINGAEPETLDPAIMTGLPEGRIAAALFEGLTVADPKTLDPLPGMAERWTISDDGCTYTFHLRKANWTNGDPVTAHDFVYSWRRALAPATASEYAYMLYHLKNGEAYNKGDLADPKKVGVRALNDATLQVTLKQRTPFFLGLTHFSTLLPVNRRCVEAHGNRWTHLGNIVTNGPFMLDDWKIGRFIRVKKNPGYYGADNVRLRSVDFLAVESANTAFNMYLSGEADFVSTIPLPLRRIVERRPDYHSGPYIGTYYYVFNVHRKPFDDARVRKAFAMAVDREKICKYITRGGEIPATSFVPDGMPHYKPIKGMCLDVDRARTLLAAAGYPGGKGFPKVELLYNTSEAHKDIAEVVQEMLKKNLGVKVELVNQEWKVYLATTKARDYQFARAAWIGDYVDPNTFLDMWVTGGGNNRAGWSNAEYDALIRRAGAEGNPEKRMELFRRAERILIEQEAAIMPIYYYVSNEMYRPEIKGIYSNIRSVHPLKFVRVERQ